MPLKIRILYTVLTAAVAAVCRPDADFLPSSGSLCLRRHTSGPAPVRRTVAMNHHRTPVTEPEPIFAPAGNEIRFPTGTGCVQTRAGKEKTT